MQKLEFANKSSKKNQKTEQKVEESGINVREGKGLNLALTKKVYRLLNSDTFYCHSESKDIYYFIRYESSFHWCSCPDNSMRSTNTKCKHIFAVEYSIKKGILKDVDKLPSFVKRDNMVSKSFKDDSYDF